MQKLKYKILLGFFLFLGLIIPTISSAQTQKTNLYFFYGNGCPHCADEEKFLDNIKNPDLKISKFEIYYNADNQKIFSEIIKQAQMQNPAVPLVIVGSKYTVGWLNKKTSGQEILSLIKKNKQNNYPDLVAPIIQKLQPNQNQQKQENKWQAHQDNKIPEKINLPFFDEIETKNFSLPLLTIIIAALDGFNPCAMWVLLFLISLLLGMENRKRMWTLGIAFIASSAAVYFLFLSAWLNLFLFIGFIFWIRIIIGLIALVSGGYHLKEYFLNKEAICKVTGSEKRRRVFDRLKQIVVEKKFIVALTGIILLAMAVNLVELVCSAGLPAIYTQVLTLSNLTNWQYYAYLLLYILIFMLDDLLIFSIAMVTLRTTGISGKYSRISNLVGGIIMLIIGLLLVLKPELLMFG